MKISRLLSWPRVVILLFWLVMTGWLIRYEAFPQWFDTSFYGYRSVFANGPLILDSWMRIEFRGTPIGYSHTWVDSQLDSPDETHTVKNTTFLNLNLMGRVSHINVNADAVLDSNYQLRHFSASLQSEAYVTQVTGDRTGPCRFATRLQTAAGHQDSSLTLPEDAMIYSPMTEMAICRLEPGQSLRFKAFDPLTLTVSDVTASAVRRETIRHRDQDRPTTVIAVSLQGLESLSWVDRDGHVLRQETPFGWTLVECAPSDAFKTKVRGQAADILTALSVPCSQPISQPRNTQRLTVVLQGLMNTLSLASPRQQVMQTSSNAIHLVLQAQAVPTNSAPFPLKAPSDLAPQLAATLALQSDHPDLKAKARAIAGDQTNSWDVARALSHWVYRNVGKKATISLPSALDVLKQREGDCNEHTYLFVALARAAGLPADIKVGLVYSEQMGGTPAFYYHAWPAVYVGEWVELDPTFGQDTVDATHLALLSGELQSQMQLMSVMGRLAVDIQTQQ